MIGYVFIKHPITAEKVAVVPTGNREDDRAEVMAISPGSHLGKLWIKRDEVLKE